MVFNTPELLLTQIVRQYHHHHTQPLLLPPTQIGWLPDKVTTMMYENPVEVILTVKKQPRHAPGATQIYFKPFRLPSKKRSYNQGYTNEYSYRNNNNFLNFS